MLRTSQTDVTRLKTTIAARIGGGVTAEDVVLGTPVVRDAGVTTLTSRRRRNSAIEATVKGKKRTFYYNRHSLPWLLAATRTVTVDNAITSHDVLAALSELRSYILDPSDIEEVLVEEGETTTVIVRAVPSSITLYGEIVITVRKSGDVEDPDAYILPGHEEEQDGT